MKLEIEVPFSKEEGFRTCFRGLTSTTLEPVPGGLGCSIVRPIEARSAVNYVRFSRSPLTLRTVPRLPWQVLVQHVQHLLRKRNEPPAGGEGLVHPRCYVLRVVAASIRIPKADQAV